MKNDEEILGIFIHLGKLYLRKTILNIEMMKPVETLKLVQYRCFRSIDIDPDKAAEIDMIE
jgi:hypothetical protein